jgi:hypothetical protein
VLVTGSRREGREAYFARKIDATERGGLDEKYGKAE